MAAIELPDKGQPLDISYLYRIVDEINRLNNVVAGGGTESLIKYSGDGQVTNVLTSEVVIFSATQQVSGISSQDSSLTTRFDFPSFKRAPVVTATAQSVSGSENIYCLVKTVSDRSCEVKLILPSGTTTQVTANISIVAVGERV